MDEGRRFVEQDQLRSIVHIAFGSARRLNSMVRLRGGSKKGVYRLFFDDGSTAILYVWSVSENYWPTPPDGTDSDRADPFSEASGADLFEASSACLSALNVRVPQVYFLDRSKRHFPSDLAVVEDVRGGTLESRLQHDPQGSEQTLIRLGTALQTMRQHQGQYLGKVALAGRGNARQDRSCEQIVLDRALRDLAFATLRVEHLAQVSVRLEEEVCELASLVYPRNEYSLIHGELGPDHVLVDTRGDPVLIDIEGTMFFDVEWEHVFLQLRFGKYYQWLRANDLDDQRLRFYTLALHLSLVAGPLRLLDGDFPEREAMMGIVEFNLQRVLAFLR